MKWLEPYAAYSRLVPALLAIAPSLNIVLALSRWESSGVSAGIAVLLAIGLPIVLEGPVRELGVATEKRLWPKWGGSPSSQLLTKTGSTMTEELVRTRWREALGASAGVPLAASDSPEDRASKIELITRWAREQTRNHDLLLAENKRYGYQRNLFALRHHGLALAALCGVVALALAFGRDGLSSTHRACVVLVAIAGPAFWLLAPAERRVQEAGFRYANALFDAAAFAKK